MNTELSNSVYPLLPTNTTDWIIGLSGGVDSIVLLSLCNKYKHEINSSVRITAVHLNHLTRGRDSDNDENFCRDLCGNLNIPFVSKRLDIPYLAQSNHTNFENTARIERHKLFRRVASEHMLSNPALLLAHHLDDNTETILMRLMRRSGLRGLAGIHPTSPLPAYHNMTSRITTFRPLINISKESIVSYARANTLDWREDKSNNDTDYTRNLLRKVIMPALNILIDSPNEKLLQIASLAGSTEEEIIKQSNNIRYHAGRIQSFIYEPSIEDKSFSAFTRKVESLCCNFFTDYLLNERSYNSLRIFFNKETNATDIARDIHIVRSNRRIYIYPKHNASTFTPYSSPPDNFYYENDSFTITIKRRELSGSYPDIPNPNIEYIPTSFADKTFSISQPTMTQMIKPIGFSGHQQVSKILKNHHIPEHIRSRIPVITCEDRVLWIPGVTLCDHAKLAEPTGEVFCLQYSEKTF